MGQGWSVDGFLVDAAEVLPGARDVLPNVSETGRFVMFATASNTIVPGINDRTLKGGVFVRDMQTGTATVGGFSGDWRTATGDVTGDGAFVAAADMTGDGRSEIAASFDGRPNVSVIDGLTGRVLSAVNLTTLPEVGATFGKGARIAARAGRVAIASGPGVGPSVRVLAFRNLAWSVEPLIQPKLGATGTTGLFIG